MDYQFSLLLAFSLFIASTSFISNDDILIRQVVNNEDKFDAFKHTFQKSYVSQDEHDYSWTSEGANFLATRKLESLSEQQLVDCDHECDPEEKGSCDAGCNGGLMNNAFEYTLKAGGLMREKDYPYTATDHGSCKINKNKVVASVSNFTVLSLDEDQIAANLVKHGPLAVAINVAYMQMYIGGVSCPFVCSKRLDHGVLLVGNGAACYFPIRMKEKSYWIIKNSWRENSGEKGYYKICKGRNVCGVDSMISTVAAVHHH